MQTYGLIKVFKDDQGNEVKMKSSVKVLGLYKSIFGTDLITDISKSFKNLKVEDLETIKELNIENRNIEDLNEEEIKNLFEVGSRCISDFDTIIMSKVIAILILNATPENEWPDFEDIMDIVPMEFIHNEKIVKVVVELIMKFIPQKKN